MNKIKYLIVLFLLIFLASPVCAQQGKQGNTNANSKSINEIGTKQGQILQAEVGEVKQVQNQAQNKVQAGNAEQNTVKSQGNANSQGAVKKAGSEKSDDASDMPSELSQQRRSRVANAVQEMLKVADRQGGVGKQIREIAQNQNKIQEEAEDSMQKAQKRSRFAKFLIGPNYKEIKNIKTKLEQHKEKIDELKQLRESVGGSYDKNILDNQIKVMEEITQELDGQATKERKGFSLLGWMNRFINR